ncbi:MFS transporter [Lentimicrobium sp.]
MEKGLSFLQIGTLIAIREITVNIFEIPTGILADSLGRRRSMISAFSCYILSFVIFFFSGAYWMLIVAMVFYAYGDAFRTGTHKAMIFEYLKIKGWENQKINYYGHTRSWSQAGSAVSAVLAALIVFRTSNYSTVFLLSVVPYAMDLFLMTTYPRELEGERQALNRGKILSAFRQTIGDFIFSFRNPGILRAILTQSVYTGYYKAVKDYLQPVIKTFALSIPLFLYLENEQRSAVMVGLIFSVMHILTALMSRYSGRFAEFFSNSGRALNLTMLAGLLMGGISGWFYLEDIYLAAIVFFTGVYLIENLRKPIGIALVADRLDRDVLATALSAESQAESLFAAMFAPLLGFIADKWGLGQALLVLSGLLLVMMPLYSANVRRKQV